jgi:hypothetical protein
MSNYDMQRGPCGTIWVTLQPLIHETKQILENSKTINTMSMDQEDRKGIDFTILSLEAVYNFLKSLQVEQEVKEMIAEETEKARKKK